MVQSKTRHTDNILRQDNEPSAAGATDNLAIRLSAEEQAAFIKLCESALNVGSVTEFKAWVSGDVRAFFPFGMMIAALGSIMDEIIFIEHIIGIDYPKEFVDNIKRQCQLSERALVARWFQEREPQVVNEDEIAGRLSAFEQEEAMQYGMRNLAVHGLIDLQGFKTSYFCFTRVPGPLTERHCQKLRLVVPQLHHAIWKLQTELATVNDNQPLSARQREILQLIAQGKTNREIAKQLKRTESTVRNHIHIILRSLGVTNRAEAAARLMRMT